MSAPSAPRGSRGAGRGRVRSNPRPRDGRVDEGEARSTRRTSPYTPSAPSRQRNPPTRANGLRGKSWRQEAGASIPQSQADTSSNVFGLTSSNARSSSNEANTSYKKRMNDLYSTVCVSPPQTTDLKGIHSDFLCSFLPIAQSQSRKGEEGCDKEWLSCRSG